MIWGNRRRPSAVQYGDGVQTVSVQVGTIREAIAAAKRTRDSKNRLCSAGGCAAEGSRALRAAYETYIQGRLHQQDRAVRRQSLAIARAIRRMRNNVLDERRGALDAESEGDRQSQTFAHSQRPNLVNSISKHDCRCWVPPENGIVVERGGYDEDGTRVARDAAISIAGSGPHITSPQPKADHWAGSASCGTAASVNTSRIDDPDSFSQRPETSERIASQLQLRVALHVWWGARCNARGFTTLCRYTGCDAAAARSYYTEPNDRLQRSMPRSSRTSTCGKASASNARQLLADARSDLWAAEECPRARRLATSKADC